LPDASFARHTSIPVALIDVPFSNSRSRGRAQWSRDALAVLAHADGSASQRAVLTHVEVRFGSFDSFPLSRASTRAMR
jgi:hypothetical protein